MQERFMISQEDSQVRVSMENGNLSLQLPSSSNGQEKCGWGRGSRSDRGRFKDLAGMTLQSSVEDRPESAVDDTEEGEGREGEEESGSSMSLSWISTAEMHI